MKALRYIFLFFMLALCVFVFSQKQHIKFEHPETHDGLLPGNIFQRLHTPEEYDGSGMGLSHGRKIVPWHKEKIWVGSIAGEKSTFYFTIRQKNVG